MAFNQKLGNQKFDFQHGTSSFESTDDPAFDTGGIDSAAMQTALDAGYRGSFPQVLRVPQTATPDTWKTNASGSWATGAKWSLGTAPTASDAATIAASGSYTVTIGAAATAQSLTIDDSGADISVNASLSLAGSLTLTAGTLSLNDAGVISGGTLSAGAGGSYQWNDGTLTADSYAGTFTVPGNGYLNIENLTMTGAGGTGAGTIVDDWVLRTLDSNTLSNATLDIDGTITLTSVLTASPVLTFGSTLNTVQSGNNNFSEIDIGDEVGTSGTFTNQGSITAAAGTRFEIDGGPVNNHGRAVTTDFINQGNIAISNGDNFEILTNAWSNSGSISVGTLSTLTLGGSFTTAGMQGISNLGGIDVVGTLNNAGATLTLGAGGYGDLELGSPGESGAVISGGTIIDPSDAFIGSGGTLSGVTYRGTLDFDGSTHDATLDLIGNNVFTGASGTGTGAIDLTGSAGELFVVDNSTLDNATLTDDGNTVRVTSLAVSSPTLTLGAHFNLLQTSDDNIAQIWLDGSYGGTTTLINQGTMTADANNGGLWIYGEVPNTVFSNQGVVAVSNGDTFKAMGSTNVTNLLGGTLTGGTWSVTAGPTLQNAASTLQFDGTITTDASNITLSGSGARVLYVSSSNVTTTLESTLATIATAGTLRLLSGRNFSGAQSFVDNGSLILGGTSFSETSLSIGSSGNLSGSGTLVAPLANSGTATALGGTLALTGAITGTGALVVDAGATLSLAAAVAAGQTARFAAQAGTLALPDASAFAGTISNFAAGDVITLGTLTATAASLSAAALTLKLSSGSTLALKLAGTPTTEHVAISSDGHTLTAYRYATASAHTPEPVAFGNHHVGDTVGTYLTLGNSAAADGFSEALDASIATTATGLTAGGSFSGLKAGVSNSSTLHVGLATSSAGTITGTATITLKTDGTGIDGYGATGIGTQTVNVSGAVYAYANPSLASQNISLGVVHVGSAASGALSLSNTATPTGYAEALDAHWGSATSGVSTAGSIAALAAGAAASTALSIGLATTSSGTLSGSAVLDLVSDGTGVDGLGTTTLTGQTITVTATVDNYAVAAFADPGGPTISGTGTLRAINLGSVKAGTAPVVLSLGADNAATGLADLLHGTLATAGAAGFTNSGFGSFSGLGAGQSEHSQSVTLSTSTAGTFSETVLLSSAGTNASGYNGTLATETLTITGTVTPSSGASTYTLAVGPNTISGAAGGDIFVASQGAINSQDSLTGGSGSNTLSLSGGGLFDLGAPSTFANIPIIHATEGQAATATAPATSQIVFMRAGTPETLTVAAGTAASGNSNPETITIYDAKDSDSFTLASGADTLYLGTGTDSVTLGGAKNTVSASGGTATISSSAANAAAAIIGAATGSTTLTLTTAGTIALNAADTHLTVDLAASSMLTLGKLGFITASGAAGNDTLMAGGANQTLIGGTADVLTGSTLGSTSFLGSSAALNGDTIGNWTTGDVIDLTDMNSATLQALSYVSGSTAGTLTVSDGTHSSALLFSSTTLGASNFTLLGSDGGNGTLIGYHS